MTDPKKTKVFADYAPRDEHYAGADQVVNDELEHLKNRRGTDKSSLKGIALSGGGIRAASFSLGILQSLARHGKLRSYDYLSTVSGGGYLGGALSWAWLDKWRDTSGTSKAFGIDASNFPYGTANRYSNPDKQQDQQQASMLRHLRQNGKYLIPGRGITALSFFSVILRSIIMGLVTLLVLSSFGYHVLHSFTPAFSEGYVFHSVMLDISVLLLLSYFFSLLVYGILAICQKRDEDQAYVWRHQWEDGIKYFLIATIVSFAIEVSELLRVYLGDQIQSAGGLTAAIGAFLAWRSQKTSSSNPPLSYIPTSILVYSGLLIFFMGLMIISNQIGYSISTIKYAFEAHLAISLIIIVSAYLIPINKVSIHRYYRDRLMETFMPDIQKILEPEGTEDALAKQANKITLHECLPANDNMMPYHIINTNIVLVESDRPKYRGRCGDNFILSPLYSGSNATGWIKTDVFANGSMTLPTAIAISGAAANSDSGVAGQGLTINPLVSAIMSIFNLRLGFWSVNPNPNYQDDQSRVPNYLKPGFRGVLNRKKLNEKADYVQLSDGGHFENLALYELIRRRCKLIICSDAEEDHDFAFNSLANIIEKARVDFGTSIRIDADQLTSLTYSHTADGKLINAEKGYISAYIDYPDGMTGKLVYFKSTLPANLPADVIGYRNSHPEFPHQTTADQFFDEKQLEAYRALGECIMEAAIADKAL